MPILALDQFGNLYETSPDREDGGGYGSHPECVEQGDLTLGAAYLKSQAQRQAAMIKLKREQAALDSRDAMTKRLVQTQIIDRKRKAQAEIDMARDPRMREALIKKAVSMGCDCNYHTPLSGNVMTANGQDGWAGMDRNQQVIHHAVTGMGRNTAYAADPEEVAAANRRAQAERLLRLKARR